MVKLFRCILGLLFTHGIAFAQHPDSVVFYEVDQLPIYKGNLRSFISNQINYPETALLDSIEGIVQVTFSIDTNGVTNNHRLLKSVRYDIDSEALRVAKLLQFETPAMNNKRPIETTFLLPIKFDIIEYHAAKKKTKSNSRKNRNIKK
jgi:TonB family protein